MTKGARWWDRTHEAGSTSAPDRDRDVALDLLRRLARVLDHDIDQGRHRVPRIGLDVQPLIADGPPAISAAAGISTRTRYWIGSPTIATIGIPYGRPACTAVAPPGRGGRQVMRWVGLHSWSGLFHQPPPRDRNNAAVLVSRADCTWTRLNKGLTIS